MQPNEPEEVVVDAAEPGAEIEADTGETVVLEPVTPDEEPAEDLTIAEAFAAARAEAEGETPDSGDEPASSEQAESAPGETPTEPVEATPTEPVGQTPEEIAADRRRLRAEIEQEIAAEKQYRELYVEHLTMQVEDPDEFIARIKSKPDLFRFMEMYAAAHPDVTSESPEGSNTPNAQAIRASVDVEYQGAITDTVRQIAGSAGVAAAEFAALQESTKGRPGALMIATFDAAVKAAVERERPNIAAAERTAAEAAAAAKYLNKTVVTPRTVAGVPSKAAPTPNASQDSISDWRDAYQESKLEIAKR